MSSLVEHLIKCAKSYEDDKDQADQITQLANDIKNSQYADLEANSLVEGMLTLAQILDLRNHPDLANILDQLVKKVLKVDQRAAIDRKLKDYRDRLVLTASLTKKSDIRKCGECPFGLSIPNACSNAGESVLYMTPGQDKINNELLEKFKDGNKCLFAVNVFKFHKAVNCNYGTVTEGKVTPQLYRGSPIYPRLWGGFSTINLDRSYFIYSDDNWYSIFG